MKTHAPRAARRNRSHLLALEPRVLFDGVALTDSPVPDKNFTLPFERPASDPRQASLFDAPAAVAVDTATNAPRELLLIDRHLPDADKLAASAKPGVVVAFIDTDKDGIAQISAALEQAGKVSAIHLLTHGTPGEVTLGTTMLDANLLQARAADIVAWQSHLTPDADLLLYGCDVGAGVAGQNFIDKLAQLSGADVAASSDLTGSAALGGNWVLERQTGPIEAKSPLADQELADYSALLLAPDPTIVIPTPGAASTNEDVSYAFPVFGVTYTGGLGTAIEAVVTLTAGNGNLVDGGVSGTQLASQGDLASINAFLHGLHFQETANWNGTATVDVTINVYNGNYDLAHLVATNNANFNITVNSVNDAPAGTNNAITINEDTSHTFTAAEFGFTDAIDSNALSAVKITTIPAGGTLKDNGTTLSAGQSVTVANINSGKLVYTPAANANGNNYGNFTFQVQDDGGTANGGADTDPSANTMTINVTAVNDAPTTVDASQSVNKNGVLTFTLAGADVDGAGDVANFRIDSISANGVLKSLAGTTLAAGNTITKAQATGMTFTPTTNYTGSTTFTFDAVDAGGLHSNVSTVTVAVNSINQPPVITVPGAQSVGEDATGWALAGISLADPDADYANDVVQASISTLHGNIDFTSTTGLTVTAGANNSHSVTVQGTVNAINTALGSSHLTYTPDANYPNGTAALTDTVTLDANDLGHTGGAAQNAVQKTITVTVNPVPDTPLTGALTALAAVNEDTLDPAGAAVSSLVTGFSDVDGNTLAGIAISADASTAGQGIWQYSVDSAISWQAVGAVAPGTALLLDSSAMLRFVPTANWNGTPGGLTIHAIDNSGTAGNNVSRTYSSNGNRLTTNVASGITDIALTGSTLGTSITSVPDPFVYVNDTYLRVDEGQTVILNDTTLKVTNVEAVASAITFTVTGTSFNNGIMQFDSAHNGTWATTITNGTTFTQADLDSGSLRYVHNGNEPNGVDQTLSYTVAEGATSANRTLTIKVSPVNDVPVLYTPGDTPPASALLTANVQKGGWLTFSTSNIQVTDPDNTNEQLVFRIESLPTNGILTVSGNAVGIGTVFNYASLSSLKYTHDNSATNSDVFSVTLRDGAGGVVNARNINLVIGNSNAAPTSIGTLSAVLFEDPATNNGIAVKNLSGYGLIDTDVGATAKGIAVVGGNSADAGTQGVWQYSTDGTHWSAIGTVNDTTGALVLSPDTLVRFVPVLNFNGNPGALSVRALDNTYLGSTSVSNGTETRVTLNTSAGNRGGTTAISDNTNTLGITFTAVDDDPVMVSNNSLNLGAGVYSGGITASQLGATDVELDTITYRLESRPTYGWLLFSGTPMGSGSIFTQADIAAGKVTYLNYYNTAGTDGFNVTVRDGQYNVQLLRPGGVYTGATIQQVHVTINLTSHAPGNGPGSTGGGGSSGGSDGYGPGTPTIPTPNSAAPAAAADVLYTDQNTPLTVWPSLLLGNDSGVGTLSITAVHSDLAGNGIVAINGGDGSITFTPVDGYAGDGGHFTYDLKDSNNNTATGDVWIHVLGVNNPLSRNLPLVLDEGATGTITNAILKAPAADCVFTLGSTLPTNGTLYKNGVALTFGSTFRQDDIDANIITFTHNGSEDFISVFNFTLTDGSGTVLLTSLFNINATPINDTPTVSASGAATLASTGATYVFNTGGRVSITLADVDGSGDKTGTGAPPAGAYQSTTSELGFHVTALPTYGKLQFNGADITAGNMATTLISAADLVAGKFQYVQNGTNNFHDNFQITPDDSKGIVIAGQLSVGTPATVLINVVPANLYPVILNDTGLTVANGKAIYEGETRIIHTVDLMGTDPDNSDSQIQFRITSNVQYGQLLLSGNILGVGSAFTQDDLNNNRVSYRHDGLEGSSDAFSFRLSDGSGGNGIAPADTVEPPGTFPIEIIPVNDNPLVTVPGARTAAEEQPLTITGITISDPDSVNRALAVNNNFGPMLVTLSANHGILTLGNTTGLTFANGTANGAATVAFTGTLGALNTALGTLTYQGNLNYLGSDTLTVRTDDLGYYGVVDVAGHESVVTIGTAAVPGVDNLHDQKTVAITVTPVNDTPTLVGEAANFYTEDATAIALGAAATPADIDLGAYSAGAGNWGNAWLSLNRQGGANAEDSFSNSGTLGALTQGGNLTLGGVTMGTVTSNSAGALKLTFADGATNAQVLSVVQQIAYTNNRQTLAAGANANVTMTWVLDDGDTDPDRVNNGQGTGGHLFTTVDQTITLTGVNDAPTRNGGATLTPAALTVTEDITAGVAGDTISNLFTASYTDVDAGNALAGIAITANASPAGEGHWQYSTDNGANWSPIANDGSITTAHALLLATTDKIRFLPDAPDYNGTPGSLSVRLIDNSAAVVSASFADVSDDATKSGGATRFSNSSNAVTLNATVNPVNDAPTISANKTISSGVTEGSAIVISSAGVGLSVAADIEATRIVNGEGGADKGKVTVTVAVPNGSAHGKVTLGGTTNVTVTAGADNSNTVSIKGLLADVNTALNGLSFTPGDNANTSETVTVTVDDLGNSGTTTTAGAKLTALQTIIIDNITQINDAPTASGNATLAAVNEDAGAAANVPNYGNLAAAAGDTVSNLFSAKFADVDTTSANHTFTGIAITANAENGTHGHWEYSTNGGANWTQVPTAGLSDAAALVIGATANDKIRFNPDAANYNGTPATPLTVRLSDGKAFAASATVLDLKALATGATDGWSSAITLSTSVTAVNDAPTISSLHNDNVAFVEAVGVNVAGIAVYIDNGRNASLGEIDLITRNETTFNGATLTVAQQGGAVAHDFFVIQTGENNISISGGFTTPSGLKLFNNGSSINYNGTSVAALTNNSATGTLQLTFNAAATGAAVDAILHNIAYSNDNDLLVAGTKDIDITFNDGNGQTSNNQGTGGPLSTTATVHITLSPSNDAPYLTAGSTITSTEDVPGTTPATPATLLSLLGGANFHDPDNAGGNALAGVAISAYADSHTNASIRGEWQVSFNGTNWFALSTLSATAGTISASNALLLSAATQVQFVPSADANTAGLAATPPRLTVFAVESGIPIGADNTAGHAPAISFSTAESALTTYNTTTDTAESRVAETSVNIDVTITPLNDAPLVTATATSPNLTENGSTSSGLSIDPVLLLNAGVTVSDVDPATNANLNSAIFGAGSITVSFTDAYVSGDVLFVDLTTLSGGVLPAGASTSGGTAGALTITLGNATTAAQVVDLLEGISYKNTGDNPSLNQTDTDRHYRIVVSDGNNVQAGGNAGGPTALNSSNIDGIITIAPTNDAPVVDLDGAVNGTHDRNVTFTEGANAANTPVPIGAASGTLLSDVDNTNLTRMVITVGSLLDGNNEVLNIDGTQFQLATDRTVTNSTSHFDIVYAGGVFTFTRNGPAIDTVTNFQTLLRGITYDTLTEKPTAGARTFDVQVTDAGVDDAGNAATKLPSNVARTTLTVVPVNDPPILTPAVGAAAFTENGSAITVDNSVTVTDLDDTQISGGTITISANYLAGDVLAVTNSGSITGVYNGTGTLTLSGTDTLANYQTVLRSLTYLNSTDDPTSDQAKPTRTLTYSLTDANSDGLGAATNTATKTINITATTDVPVMNAGGTLAYTENQAAQVIDASVAVASDADDTQMASATAQITAGLTTGDVLAVSSTTIGNVVAGTNITVTSYNAGTGLLTLTGADTLAHYSQVLKTVTFNSTSADPTATSASRTVTWQTTDANSDATGAGTSVAVTSTINITAINDVPVITPAGAAAAWTENTAAITVDNTVTVSDLDDTQIAGGTVTISGNYLAGDVLAVTNSGGITGVYDGSGTLTLSGTATLAQYQTVLRSLTYVNSTDDPTSNQAKPTRTLTYSLTDANSDSVGAATGTATKTINITATTDVPVMSAGGTLTYTENQAATVIDANVAVASDADDTQMATATAQITAGLTAGDVLAVSGMTIGNLVAGTNITVTSYNAGTGLLTLTGADTLANYTAVLKNVTYNSTSLNPTVDHTVNSRTVTWRTTDANSDATGAGTSVAVTSTVNIGAINEAPVITPAGANAAWTENAAAITVDNTVTVADADDTQISGGSVTISGNYLAGDVLAVTNSGGISGSYVGGTLTLSGTATLAQYQTVLRTLTYVNSTDDPTSNTSKPTRTLTYSLTDANAAAVGAATGTATKTIDITATTDNPVMSAGGTLTYTENQPAQVIDASVAVASDADDTQMASATAQITAGLTAGDVLAVSGTTIGSQIAGTNITVASYNSGTGLLTLTGADTLAHYTAALKTVTYNSTVEDVTLNNTAPSRTITWRTTDTNSDATGAGTSVAVTSTINIRSLNDTPTITGLDAFSVNATSDHPFLPGGTAIVIDPNVTFADQELATERNNWNGATLSISRQGGASAEDELGATGTILNGGNIVVGATTIGSYAYANTKGTLTLTFNGSATTALVDTAVQGITYRNTNSAPSYASVTLSYTLNDQNPNITGGGTAGTGQDQGGGGKLLASANIEIFMNHPPVANNDTAAVSEGISASSNSSVSGNVIGTNPHIAASGDTAGQDSDADHDTLVVQGVVAGDQHLSALSNANVGANVVGHYGSINITSTGAYTYVLDNTRSDIQALAVDEHPPLAEIFTYTINDGKGGKSTATVTITITGTNDVPLVSDTVVTGTVVEQITPNGNLTSSGALTFTDVDLADVHTITTAPLGTTLGTLTAVKNTDTTDLGTGGQLTWNYTVADSAVEYLAAGQTKVEQFTVTVDDGHGGVVDRTVSITIIGTNDAPLVSDTVVTGAVTEQITPAGNLTSSGALTFTDVDLADVHTITTTPIGSPLGTLTAVKNTDTTGSGSGGQLTWTYTVADSAVEYLATGESKVEQFTVKVDDGHGGVVNRTVTITINGTNDVPVMSDTVVTGTVTEQITPAGNLTSTGAITYTDVDLTDAHTITAAPIGSPLGTLTAVKNTDTTGSGTGGQLTWNYTVADSVVEYLAAGQTKVEQFTVTVDDGHGGVVNRIVSITINGTNDVPLVSDTVVTGTVTEQITPAGNLTSSGALTFTDVDLADVHTITTAPIGSPLGSLTAVKNTDTTGSGTGGQLTWNYSVADSAVEYLAAGETKVEQFTVKVDDGHGGVVDRIVSITINGTNDVPLVSDTVVTGAVTEQATPGNLTSSGALTFSDVDLSDSHTITTAPLGTTLGTLTAVKNTDTTGSGTGGQLTWIYTVANSAVEYLAAGETKVEQFTVTVDDGHGGVVNRTISITINGTDPVVTGTPAPTPPVPVVPVPTSPVTEVPVPVLPVTEVPEPILPAAPAGSVPPAEVTVTLVPGGTAPPPAKASAATFSLFGTDASKVDEAGRIDLRASLPGLRSNSTSGDTSSDSRKLESTDRGFPVERLQVEAAKVATTQDQQKGGDRLFVYNGIKGTTTEVGQSLDYRVPKDAFGHTNTTAIVQLEASLSDGSPLPEWMDFDPTSGTFSGKPPANGTGTVEVKVTARDDQGREVSANFKMQVEGKQASAPAPGPSADAGEQDLPDGKALRLAVEKPLPAKRGAIPFSDQLKLSKRDPLVERILSRQHAAARTTVAQRLVG